jgi:hypothetical protein
MGLRAGSGARWNDPAFAIEWSAPSRVISERDTSFAASRDSETVGSLSSFRGAIHKRVYARLRPAVDREPKIQKQIQY